MANYITERMETVVGDYQEFLAECIDVPKFLACCQQCDNYNIKWSCPPFEFDPMDIWHKYNKLRLYALVLRPSDEMGSAELVAALHSEKPGFDQRLSEMEAEHPGSLYLSGGSCALCSDCRRAQGQVCRYPDKLRYSIEALGGDVGKVCEKYFDKPILWVQDNKAPEYLMLIGGLLLP
ncbi:MAG: DUF2284 domain-containing protein [Firmicutes bacterium]|nr:DUF2284 domain-containing protein [Bacillota bacterium]MBQ3199327.1 DUF2284 domain-containing protein [Bacillota bacterium]